MHNNLDKRFYNYKKNLLWIYLAKKTRLLFVSRQRAPNKLINSLIFVANWREKGLAIVIQVVKMAVPCSDDNSDYNISREIYKSHQTQLEDILTTSDITRNSLASRLYENRLISEKVMDIIHKNKKEDQDLAALLLRELRLKIETHFEDILKIMKTEESLRSIAIKMRNQFIPMATPFSPIETTSPVYNRSTSDPGMYI